MVYVASYFVSSIFFPKNLGVHFVHWFMFFSNASEATEAFFASSHSPYEFSVFKKDYKTAFLF